MLISVVVPVYNEVFTLPRYLPRLQQQASDDQAVELLVVDGRSSDGTSDWLDQQQVPWIPSPRSRATQMNMGAAVAQGELLLFLHADTRLPIDAFHRVRSAVRSGVIGGYFGVRVDSNRLLMRITGRLISLRSQLTGVATGDQAMFVRRDIFEQLGGFANLPLFEDIELSRRLKRCGAIACLRQEVTTSARRWEQFGLWRTIARMWLLRLLYYLRIDPGRLARYYEIAR